MALSLSPPLKRSSERERIDPAARTTFTSPSRNLGGSFELFLLNYVNDVELRKQTRAATNKSEEFNNFVKRSKS